MFFDFIPSVVPLRAIAFQIVFLLMAIAIEATVLHKQLNIPPKQSVQFAASINLLTTVLGWLVTFLLLGTSLALPTPLLTELKIALMNFIFFDQWSNGTAELLIMICFITFFVSLGMKWLGLVGLDWLMKKDLPKAPDVVVETGVFVSPQRKPRQFRPRLNTTLVANAWSYSAILVALLLRIVFQSNLNVPL
ncbi:MAG: hypothetical protein KME11_20340 [Timaviella obliquedivisa GSE-PSE-MK23-08B]|jgi:hypothetical protein|nr:hypothetical protein [Timaviella obliquedivisa GSE-PSE-MK23-08B]